jgi:salicylate hydroxylase
MPTLAQGANMAIEDGYVLARLLTRQAGDVETALLAYPIERKPRTDWVTLKSREQFANNRKESPPPFVDRTWLFVNDVVGDQGALQPA